MRLGYRNFSLLKVRWTISFKEFNLNVNVSDFVVIVVNTVDVRLFYKDGEIRDILAFTSRFRPANDL